MRAFLAINISGLLHDTVSKIIQEQPLEDLRWSKPEHVHVTLKFFENLAPEFVPTLSKGLHEAIKSIKPFTITATKTICFPEKRPRIFAAAIRLDFALAELVRVINETCSQFDFPRENRAYLPHLTLGRFKKPPTELPQNYIHQPIEQAVSQFVLYKSEPNEEGSNYTLLDSFELLG